MLFFSDDLDGPPPRKSDVVKSKENLYDKIPESLRAECLVRSKVEEDETVLKERQEMTRNFSPSELSRMHGLSDFPMPTLRRKNKNKEDDTDNSSKAKENETLYEKLPESLKAECLVRMKVETDPKTLRERQEMTRSMSPAELGKIGGLSDLPFPTLRKKIDSPEKGLEEKVKSKENLYERLPGSLKTECLVRSKVQVQETVLKQRQEMIRSMSPAELGQISSLSDIPIPTLRKKRGDQVESKTDETIKSKENLYDRLPDSLKAECLVRTKVEVDETVLKQRQEITRNLSPGKLSQMHGLSDFPLPKFSKAKSDKELSPPSEKKSMYARLPESLKSECLVRAKIEEDEMVLKQRQEISRAMSPAKLGEIHGISDFPLPTIRRSKKEKTPARYLIFCIFIDLKRASLNLICRETDDDQKSKILPNALTVECIVRAKVEDPEKQKERAEMVKSKSVHELAQISSLSDFPLPAVISKRPRPVERKKKFRETYVSNP